MNGELNGETIMAEIAGYVNDDVSFIDALVYYANKHDIEIEIIGDIVRRSQIMKSKVLEDAEKFNLVEKTNKLPL